MILDRCGQEACLRRVRVGSAPDRGGLCWGEDVVDGKQTYPRSLKIVGDCCYEKMANL